ncbi:MAG: solute carrier family 23 protein [Desulfosporosinus sp.]
MRKGLMSDGVSTFLAGMFNTFPQTPFAQNVGLVGLPGIKSRFVAVYAGIILLVPFQCQTNSLYFKSFPQSESF